MFTYALRYFVVVAVVPRLFVVAFVIAVAAAAARLTADPTTALDALMPVLILQLFVASSGFQILARRGHYDLLFTSGASRWQIALAHCVVSIVPGLVAWLCVAALELAASHGTRATALAAGTLVSVIGSSVVAWGIAAHSSRTAGTILWLLLMTIPTVARIVSPVRLLGATLAGAQQVSVVSAAVGAGLVFGISVLGIVRADTPLEASQ